MEVNIEAVDHHAKQRALFRGVSSMLQPDEPRTEERHKRHGEEVRSEDGDDYSKREIGEDVLADAVQQEDWKEDDGGADGCGKDGERYLLTALGSGTLGIGAVLHETDNVFEHDDRVIDETRQDQGHTTEQHSVERAAEGPAHQHAEQQGHGDGEQRGDRGLTVAEEEKDHEAREREADQCFLQQVAHRAFDEERLIEDDRGFQDGRDVDEVLDGGGHAVDDLDGVAFAGLLEDRYIDGVLSIDANDVGLDGAGVLGVSDVRDEHGRVAGGLEGHGVDLLRAGDLTVGVQVVVLGANAHVARGQNEVGLVHAIDYVHEAHVVGFELQRIDIDLNLAITAAIRLRHGSAGHVGDLVADLELCEVFEIGLVEAFAFERDEAYGLARCGHAEHDGRQRPGGQAAQIGHGEVGDVAERGIRVGTRTEVDLDERDARERARLDVVDIGAEGEETLEGVGDVAFDLLRRHAGVERGNDDDRNINGREEIDRHGDDVDDADDEYHESDHDDEEGIAEGKFGHVSCLPALIHRSCRLLRA